jgi:hypothetical protein
VKKKTAESENQIELSSECDFRDVDSGELEACCFYEYFRESALMRKTRVLAMCEDQLARSTLSFVLSKSGWQKAADTNEAPPPWKSLKAETKTEIDRCIKACLSSKSKDQERHPPLLVREFLPGHDPVELKSQFDKWKDYAYYGTPPAHNFPFGSADPRLFLKAWHKKTSSRPHPLQICAGSLAPEKEPPSFPLAAGRDYFFGLFRLDETYNETDAVRAFRAWFRERWAKTKGGGGAKWLNRLKRLAVIRIWKHERDPWKRLKLVAKFCHYKGCRDEVTAYKERCKQGRGDQQMGKAAQVEMSNAAQKHGLSFKAFSKAKNR